MKFRYLAVPMMLAVLVLGCSSKNDVEEAQEQNPVTANNDPVVTETPPVVMETDPLPVDTSENLESFIANKSWRIQSATYFDQTLSHEAGMTEMVIVFRTDPSADQWDVFGVRGEGYVDINYGCGFRTWNIESEQIIINEVGPYSLPDEFYVCDYREMKYDVYQESEFNTLAGEAFYQMMGIGSDVGAHTYNIPITVTHYEATGELLLEHQSPYYFDAPVNSITLVETDPLPVLPDPPANDDVGPVFADSTWQVVEVYDGAVTKSFEEGMDPMVMVFQDDPTASIVEDGAVVTVGDGWVNTNFLCSTFIWGRSGGNGTDVGTLNISRVNYGCGDPESRMAVAFANAFNGTTANQFGGGAFVGDGRTFSSTLTYSYDEELGEIKFSSTTTAATFTLKLLDQ